MGTGGGGPVLVSSSSSLLPFAPWCNPAAALWAGGGTAVESMSVDEPTATTTSLRATDFCEEALLGDSMAPIPGRGGLGGVEVGEGGACRMGEEKGVWSLSSAWLLMSVVEMCVSSLDADER